MQRYPKKGLESVITVLLFTMLALLVVGSIGVIVVRNSSDAGDALIKTYCSLTNPFKAASTSPLDKAPYAQCLLDSLGPRALKFFPPGLGLNDEGGVIFVPAAGEPCIQPVLPGSLGQGLLAFYQFERPITGQEGDIFDSMCVHHGTSMHGVQQASTGVRSTSAVFDGVDDLVTIPSSYEDALNLAGDSTVSFWLKSVSLTAGQHQEVISKGFNQDCQRGACPVENVPGTYIPRNGLYEVWVAGDPGWDSPGPSPVHGVGYTRIGSDGDDWELMFGASMDPFNVFIPDYTTTSSRDYQTWNQVNDPWHQVVVVTDNAPSGAPRARIYIDGVLAYRGLSDTLEATSFGGPYGSDKPVLFGGYFDDSRFEGNLDEVMFYNRALSGAEVQQLYNLQFEDLQVVAQSVFTLNKAGSAQGTIEVQGVVNGVPTTIVCDTTCTLITQPFDTGTQIHLSVTPVVGAVFGGWGGHAVLCGADLMCTIAATGATDVNADFSIPTINARRFFNVEAYQPGTAMQVSVLVMLGGDDCGAALEEQVPTGWTVSDISGEGAGVFTSADSTIRWAPLEGTACGGSASSYLLRYTLTPPITQTGSVSFSGAFGVDGYTYPIGGSTTLLNA